MIQSGPNSTTHELKQVIVGSKNPAKIEAVKQSFTQVFPSISFEFIGCQASSGVSDQPMSDQETQLGAKNRVLDCQRQYPNADYWVGLEGGCEFIGKELEAYAWMHIEDSKTKGKARTASFILPPAVAALVSQGMELGEADDLVFDRTNSKQHSGAVGLLTQGLIDRSAYYQHALVLALIPFLNTPLYDINPK